LKPIPCPLALFGGKGKGNALISSFYGIHDIDIEYISLLITAFLVVLTGLFIDEVAIFPRG